jgi:hypothetical protein
VLGLQHLAPDTQPLLPQSVELLQEAGAEAQAEAWLARISSPAPYQHLRPLARVPTAIDLFSAAMQADADVDMRYQQGQLSLLMRCALVQQSVCWYHALVRSRRAVQLVPLRLGVDAPAWWSTPKLPAVVIDYTALLTT